MIDPQAFSDTDDFGKLPHFNTNISIASLPYWLEEIAKTLQGVRARTPYLPHNPYSRELHRDMLDLLDRCNQMMVTANHLKRTENVSANGRRLSSEPEPDASTIRPSED